MDWDVFMLKPDQTYRKMKVGELLPLGFSPEQLFSVTSTPSQNGENAVNYSQNGHSVTL